MSGLRATGNARRFSPCRSIMNVPKRMGPLAAHTPALRATSAVAPRAAPSAMFARGMISDSQRREHLELLGLRMDNLKHNNGQLCETTLTNAFSEAVVQGVGRCSEFTALRHAYDSLMSYLSAGAAASAGTVGSRVRVVRGRYAGSSGVLVRTTAARVVIQLDSGGEVALAGRSICFVDVSEEEGVWVAGERTQQPHHGRPALAVASVFATSEELRAMEFDELADGRAEVDDGYSDVWHDSPAQAYS
eukprot:COSAG01_NODE_15588_length_1321_cov_1.147300_1_plen_247_part_00